MEQRPRTSLKVKAKRRKKSSVLSLCRQANAVRANEIAVRTFRLILAVEPIARR